MALTINYLSLINVDNNRLGQIDFFDTYRPPSRNFPYFFIDQRNITLNSLNWPELVPFLYDQKIKIIQTNKTEIAAFAVASFTNTAGQVATLNFTNVNSITVLADLIEDRESYFLENGESYTGWNKTFTPLSAITSGGTTFFAANANYFITGITVDTVNNTGTITATSLSATVVSTPTVLSNINLEFGFYRIPGQLANQSVYYSLSRGRLIMNNNTNLFLSGLKVKSQIIGHTHEHIHDMNNHTHNFPHTHDLNNHSHGMNHQHGYYDSLAENAGLGSPGNPLAVYNITTFPFDVYRETNTANRDFTDGPNINSTGPTSNLNTDSISNNITSGVSARTTNQDDNFSNNNNLKINSKILPETYTVYQYIYGRSYFE